MTLIHMWLLPDRIYLMFILNLRFSDIQAVRSLVHQEALQPLTFLMGVWLSVFKVSITLLQCNLGSDCCGKNCVRKSRRKPGQRLPILCSGADQELRQLPVVSARDIWQPSLGLAITFADMTLIC